MIAALARRLGIPGRPAAAVLVQLPVTVSAGGHSHGRRAPPRQAAVDDDADRPAAEPAPARQPNEPGLDLASHAMSEWLPCSATGRCAVMTILHTSFNARASVKSVQFRGATSIDSSTFLK